MPLLVRTSLSTGAALQMRGTVSAQAPWDVMVDLFFYREPEEAKEEGEGGDPYQEGTFNAGLPQPQGLQYVFGACMPHAAACCNSTKLPACHATCTTFLRCLSVTCLLRQQQLEANTV